jgi:kynureninase
MKVSHPFFKGMAKNISLTLEGTLEGTLEDARELDRKDPLREMRERFWIPVNSDGGEQLYFCGNSLGLQPKSTEAAIGEELERWRRQGVEGHFKGENPWLNINEQLSEPMAKLVGARPREIVFMNTLTVNLHMMMISFYRPRGRRRKLVIEKHSFPSDRYAAESQIRLHGLDPDECLVEIEPDPVTRLIDESSLEAYLECHGEEVALVLWPGVQYATGQVFKLERISQAAQRAGAQCGFDLAHAVGNVPLNLHDNGVDFACWCTYKYLNAGTGAVAGCFVHEKHSGRTDLPRLNGWWGNAPDSRFDMAPEFKPAQGAAAWQASNPPILAMAPIRAALDIFEEAGFDTLRAKSVRLTAYLESLVRTELGGRIEIITPAEPERRGCQLSLKVLGGAGEGRRLFEHLESIGTVPDWREPDIIRVSPVPLYNRYEDCWQFVDQVKRYFATRSA